MAPQTAPDWRARAREVAARHRLDPDIFERQIARESQFNPTVRSHKGAIGLGQLMPDTAKELGVDPLDPEQNLEGSARYLRQQLDTFGGDYRKALAAYNAGAGRVKEHGGVPPFKETQEYVTNIMGPRTPGELAGRKVRTPDGKTYRIPAGATPEQVTRFLASLRPAGAAPSQAPTQAAPAAPPVAEARPAPVDTVPSHLPLTRRPIADAPPAQIEGPEFLRGLHSGLSGSNVTALGRGLKAVGATDLGESLKQAGQREAQVPKVASFRDVRSAGEFFDYIQFQVGQGLASTVPSVGGATVGGLGGFAVGGPVGAVVGGTAGALAPSYVLNFGDIEEEVEAAMPNASPLERAQIAAVIAAPVAALDVVGPARLGGKAAKRLAVQKVIQEAAKRGLIERGLREGFKSGTTEAITEATQEAVQAVAVAQASGQKVDPEQLVTRLVDAGIGGFATGAVLGGATEAIPQRKAKLEDGLREERRGPTVAESAAIRKNLEPPKAVPAHLVAVGAEASAELGGTVAEVQNQRPMSFRMPGLEIEQAHIFPELIRVFPGDPQPVRVTVMDRITGRIYSLQLPGIQEFQQAIDVEAPQTLRPAPGVEGVEVEKPERVRLRPEFSAKVVDATKPPRLTRKEYKRQQRALEEQAAAAEAERTATAPKAILALRKQIAERPGDKNVRKWKRRLAKLEERLPKPKKKAGPGNPPTETTGAAVGLGASSRGAKAPPPKKITAGDLDAAKAQKELKAAGHVTRQVKPGVIELVKFGPGVEEKLARQLKGHQEQERRAGDRRQVDLPPVVERRVRARRVADMRSVVQEGKRRINEIRLAATRVEVERVFQRHTGQIPKPGTSLSALRAELLNEAESLVKGARQAVKGSKAPKSEASAHIGAYHARRKGKPVYEKVGTLGEIERSEKPGAKAAPAKAPPPPEPAAAAPAKTPTEKLAEQTATPAGTKPVTKSEAEAALKRGAVYHGMDDKPLAAWYQRLFGKTYKADKVTYSDAHDRVRGELHRIAGREPYTDPENLLKRKPASEAPKPSYIQAFEDLARQGKSLEDATEGAQVQSGAEPPAGLDLAARHSRIRRETQEGAGQEDIFGGAAILGAPSGTRTEADLDPVERAKPPGVSEAASQAERPSEAKDVALEGLWYWEGFQNREVPRGTAPTQSPGDLVNAEHIRQLSETRGGFDLEEVRRRPILVWTDTKGELGEKGRRYVIDGHHRTYMAKEAGAKRLPAVEVFGDLAYAKSQAQVTNLASKPNTYSEQARIARELLDRGDPLSRVAAQLRVQESRVKRMIDFAHLDPGVRGVFFPSGQETGILTATSYGEVVGKYARESPELMTGNMQHRWLSRAVDDDMRPGLFADEVRQWHSILTAARQELIDLGKGIQGVKLAMTPKQFAATQGRLMAAIDARRREAAEIQRGLARAASMARAEGRREALRFLEEKSGQIGEESIRLVEAKKEVEQMIREALTAGMQGTRDLASSFDAIQKRVDEIVGPDPVKPRDTDEIIRGRRGVLFQAILAARRRLRGIARRDPIVKQIAQQSPPPTGPVEKILAALKAAKPVRRKQQKGYTRQRIERIKRAIAAEKGLAGQARLRARLRSLQGTYQKEDFESIARALNQQDVDALVDMIMKHPGLQFFEKANAGIALQKLLGEEGGQVPQKNEIELLEIVFGQEFVDAIGKLRPQIMDARSALYAIANVTRTLRTSFDLSAPLRQGLYLAPSYPKEWGAAWFQMHRYWRSEEAFREGMEDIYNDPLFKVARRSGLAITSASNANLDMKEEAFLGAQLAEKIPVLGAGVRRSDRAYVGFLNKLRMDVFKNLVALAEANESPVETGTLDRQIDKALEAHAKAKTKAAEDPALQALIAERDARVERGKRLAAFVNAGTGRGNSKFIQRHAQGLNAMFFSPRFQASRLHLQNPLNYIQADPFVRRQYIRSTAALTGAAAMVLTLAAWAGARVEWDRLNGDWGKIRVGKTVYDVLGGFAQYLRFWPSVTEALRRQATGRRQTRRGNALEITTRFVENKLSPAAGFLVGWLRGKATEEDIAGPRGRFQFGHELIRTFVPMLFEDIWEVAKKDPVQIPAAVPAALYGTSVSTYPRPKRG